MFYGNLYIRKNEHFLDKKCCNPKIKKKKQVSYYIGPPPYNGNHSLMVTFICPKGDRCVQVPLYKGNRKSIGEINSSWNKKFIIMTVSHGLYFSLNYNIFNRKPKWSQSRSPLPGASIFHTDPPSQPCPVPLIFRSSSHGDFRRCFNNSQS